jgi:hypothetical protein
MPDLVPVVVAVPVAMPPGPILFLFFRGQPAEVSVSVTVILSSPLVIVNDFVVVPDVVVAVIGVIDPVMVCASSAHYRKESAQQPETMN